MPFGRPTLGESIPRLPSVPESLTRKILTAGLIGISGFDRDLFLLGIDIQIAVNQCK